MSAELHILMHGLNNTAPAGIIRRLLDNYGDSDITCQRLYNSHRSLLFLMSSKTKLIDQIRITARLNHLNGKPILEMILKKGARHGVPPPTSMPARPLLWPFRHKISDCNLERDIRRALRCLLITKTGRIL